jgi:hypothetical protein
MENYEQQEIRGYQSGPITVDRNVAVHGYVDGDVYVKCGGIFTLWGMVQGNVYVAPRACASINGIINGGLHNFGGAATIFDGTVDEVVDHAADVVTKVHLVANIRGSKRGCD